MPIVRVEIPLWDGVDTNYLVGARIFDSKATEIQMTAGEIVYEDDFSVDTGDWALTLASISGGALNLQGDGYAYNTDPALNVSNFTLYVKCTDSNTAQPEGLEIGIKLNGETTAIKCDIHRSSGLVRMHWGGVRASQAYTSNPAITYWKIRRIGTTYYCRIYSDAAFSIPICGELSWNYGISRTVEGIYLGDVAGYTDYALTLDDFVYVDETGYTTESPSPTAVWTAFPVGTEIDMATIRILPFKDEVMQLPTSTNVKFQYAVNGGALNGIWLTQAELRAESNPTITNETNAIKIIGQYNSDGSYKSGSSSFALVGATCPEGNGNGNGKLDKFGYYGHRRIGA